MKNELLEIYYSLYDILGEVEAVADAIKELTLTTKSRGAILQHLEFTRLWNLTSELNQLYDMPLHTLTEYRIKWNLRGHGAGYQTIIFDFLPEENN